MYHYTILSNDRRASMIPNSDRVIVVNIIIITIIIIIIITHLSE